MKSGGCLHDEANAYPVTDGSVDLTTKEQGNDIADRLGTPIAYAVSAPFLMFWEVQK